MSSAEVATSSPSTRICPSDGTTKPSRALSIVLFPAPFGPSRPTAPDGNAADTSRRAVCRPYITVTPRSSTTEAPLGQAGWPREGSVAGIRW